MEDRALHALELPKVLACLAGFTVSEAGFFACKNLAPLREAAALHSAAALFEQGRLWVLRSEKQLKPFPAIEGMLQHLAAPHTVLDLDDLFALRQLISQGKELTGAMTASPGADQIWPLWLQKCEELAFPAQCQSALTRCFTDEGLIRDEASPELSVVRVELRNIHRQCSKKVKDYAAEYNILHYLQDSFMTLSSDRYVLPLKANFKGRLQGVIHDFSQTGETCYFEPLFLVELNNRLQELKREEREEERKILLYLSELARQESAGIRSLHDFLVQLDMLQARAKLADCYDGRMVAFDAGRSIMLHDARHPLLALLASPMAAKAYRAFQRKQSYYSGITGNEEAGEEEATVQFRNRAPVIPSTLELHDGQHALVISGGNAGGKTVCLKSLGLIALMGQCILPVPVGPGSFLPPFAHIHAFIGDEQSLDDDVSTFTAQITHLGRIWPELGPDALVILDEFGAGTDPSQGAALAQAVVDSIMETGAYVVAATHFPALKAYALSTEGVRAASVLFDPSTKKPLFRLVYDQVGASQALDVAREHGLPEKVLKRAEQYLLVSGDDSSALVERLNTLAVEKERELTLMAKEKAAFSEKRRNLQQRFEAERARLFDSLRADAAKVLADWKAAKVTHKQALKELSRLRTNLGPTAQGEEQDTARKAVDVAGLSLRSKVRHLPFKRDGVVLEVDERKKRVRLDFDGVSLWAEAADIELPDQEKREQGASHSSGTGGYVSSSVLPLRLDLRGLRADVALSDLEKFLDRALLGGRDVVEVIHGRGTGVLRREIHSFLKNFPAIREYRLASEEQGGDGMTIVELK
ncbi:Smr/MutS family protein [Desulfovibrio sp. OttesenSCG-928-G15]|nr:Smr/MutS family protein [Desulfovibrio sp. OttesenSCG-928-G15]